MNDQLADFAQWLSATPAQEGATWLLRTVPGLPPILQTIHLLSIAAIVASTIFINLRFLRLAVRSQSPTEMIQRLMPWTWGALVLLLLSGLPFLLARPGRYLVNPVFQIKFSLLLPALVLAFVFYWLNRRERGYWEAPERRYAAFVLAAISLLLWIGVVMAGRWIAYSDYLFWPG